MKERQRLRVGSVNVKCTFPRHLLGQRETLHSRCIQWVCAADRSSAGSHARGDDRRTSYPGKMGRESSRFRPFSFGLLLGPKSGHSGANLGIKFDNNGVVVRIDTRVQQNAALLHHSAERVVVDWVVRMDVLRSRWRRLDNWGRGGSCRRLRK